MLRRLNSPVLNGIKPPSLLVHISAGSSFVVEPTAVSDASLAVPGFEPGTHFSGACEFASEIISMTIRNRVTAGSLVGEEPISATGKASARLTQTLQHWDGVSTRCMFRPMM